MWSFPWFTFFKARTARNHECTQNQLATTYYDITYYSAIKYDIRGPALALLWLQRTLLLPTYSPHAWSIKHNSKINQLIAVARGLAVRVHYNHRPSSSLSILRCNGFVDKKIDLPEGEAGYCAKDRKGREASHPRPGIGLSKSCQRGLLQYHNLSSQFNKGHWSMRKIVYFDVHVHDVNTVHVYVCTCACMCACACTSGQPWL